MNTQSSMTCPLLAALFLLAGGCVTTHHLGHDSGPPAPDADSGHSPAAEPEPDPCRTSELLAGDETLEILGPDGSVERTHRGSWTTLRHPADVAARLRVELLEVPTGAPEPAFGYLASPGWPSVGSLAGFGFGRAAAPFEMPLYAPEQRLFLGPLGARYRVSICFEGRDPFPICSWHGTAPECEGIGAMGITAPAACACLPPCAVDGDCPVPLTGDVAPRCSATHTCVLPCDATVACPDGQACTPLPPDTHLGPGAAICMTHRP